MIYTSGNEKCKCPFREQSFTPENGLTPEIHIAQGIIKVFKEMQDTSHIYDPTCPRCGHKRMKEQLAQNAVSRYADVYICDECDTDEALRDMQRNTLSVTDWFIVCGILKYISTNCK